MNKEVKKLADSLYMQILDNQPKVERFVLTQPDEEGLVMAAGLNSKGSVVMYMHPSYALKNFRQVCNFRRKRTRKKSMNRKKPLKNPPALP